MKTQEIKFLPDRKLLISTAEAVIEALYECDWSSNAWKIEILKSTPPAETEQKAAAIASLVIKIVQKSSGTRAAVEVIFSDGSFFCSRNCGAEKDPEVL